MSEFAEQARLDEITFDKETRLALDKLIVALRARGYRSPERTLAFRAMQQARHWLGEDLAILGAQHPYPNGNNPANTIVDPPADTANRRADVLAQLQKDLDAQIKNKPLQLAADGKVTGIGSTNDDIRPQGTNRHVHDLPSPRC
ncbi:MAG TPA: hypothetical protein VM656_13055 [Pyrinomonadaceae bacterium]|jgi:hypothetical protein|nr:hypothetical protein [Pyrinomonadaceae bacterium]